MKLLQIQEITASDLRNIISETVKTEVSKLLPKEQSSKKLSIYGTRKEVAKELKISLPILNEHTKNGTLKGYRIGGRVLYKWDEVFEALKEIQSLKYKRNLK